MEHNDRELKNMTIHFENDTAKLIDPSGKEIPLDEFSDLVEKFKNYLYDRRQEKYGNNRLEPLDEFTKKRLNIEHYILLEDNQRGELRDIYEAYIERFLILDNYTIYKGRRVSESGFYTIMDIKDAKKILPLIEKFIEEMQ
ncbi:hypothetical protein B14911_10952 [Bacillus sp. NRRL B-14911]|uniref:hypothetical protein n=1 Tax=Bacillus sp. NRRL B-14911 TaxID=313627 RepID=UPI00006B59B8|nr:hypothetical protein [Bacillus sp. NRRL B-14911]EAR66248.1 hypothetical protein B14911_10952 [Bacillus sp. NRRL B-14911]